MVFNVFLIGLGWFCCFKILLNGFLLGFSVLLMDFINGFLLAFWSFVGGFEPHWWNMFELIFPAYFRGRSVDSSLPTNLRAENSRPYPEGQTSAGSSYPVFLGLGVSKCFKYSKGIVQTSNLWFFFSFNLD